VTYIAAVLEIAIIFLFMPFSGFLSLGIKQSFRFDDISLNFLQIDTSLHGSYSGMGGENHLTLFMAS
jgi:hypothetical protein